MTYPIGRFLLEYIRGDARMRLGSFDMAQVISLILIMTGIILWWCVRQQTTPDKRG